MRYKVGINRTLVLKENLPSNFPALNITNLDQFMDTLSALMNLEVIVFTE